MQKYVFFTNSMGGYSGGPSYVCNKLKYLREYGWDVAVFDSTGDGNAKIELKVFKEFESNRYQELYYYPQLLRESRRERVIAEIIEKIGTFEEIVIESDGPQIAIWGEIIAKRIGAKHIVFILSENLIIDNQSLYEYLKFKANRNEMFSISVNAYKKLMSKFETAIDAENHYLSALTNVPIEDVVCEELSQLGKSKFTIGHLGRYKSYFKYMFQNVADFARLHQNEAIDFVLLGVDSVSQELQDILPFNLYLKCISSRRPIPKRFYDITDVVIATAGCAGASFRNGAKVISMDVFNNNPLGVLGYDTIDTNIRSNNNHYNLSLSETLENVLVKKKYEGNPIYTFPKGRGFDYHLRFATLSDGKYYDVEKINIPRNGKISFLIKLDLVGLCSEYRYFMHRWSLR